MRKYIGTIVIVIILLIALADTLQNYAGQGLLWDYTVNILNAKAFLTPSFYSYFFSGHASAGILTTSQFYIEPFRDPLVEFIQIPLLFIFQNYMVVFYLVLVPLLMLLALAYFSRATDTNLLLLVTIFFVPFVIFNLFLLDGEEGLSLVIMIFAVALLVKQKWQSGVALGLAGLAKYPSLIFLPLVLLLPKKERNLAIAAFAITTLPFLLLNYFAYGNPIQAYITEMSYFSGAAAPYPGVIFQSLIIIFFFMLPAIVALILFLMYTSNSDKEKMGLKLDDTVLMLFYAAFLGVLGWAYLARNPAIYSTPRMGYLIYLGAGLGVGFLLSKFIKYHSNSKAINLGNVALAVLSIVSVASMAYYFILAYQQRAIYTVGTNWPGFLNASHVLAQHSLAGCSVVSNDWVYLIYDNVTAYQPDANLTSLPQMPILDYGVGGTGALNIPPDHTNYTYDLYTLVVPANVVCYH